MKYFLIITIVVLFIIGGLFWTHTRRDSSVHILGVSEENGFINVLYFEDYEFWLTIIGESRVAWKKSFLHHMVISENDDVISDTRIDFPKKMDSFIGFVSSSALLNNISAEASKLSATRNKNFFFTYYNYQTKEYSKIDGESRCLPYSPEYYLRINPDSHSVSVYKDNAVAADILSSYAVKSPYGILGYIPTEESMIYMERSTSNDSSVVCNIYKGEVSNDSRKLIFEFPDSVGNFHIIPAPNNVILMTYDKNIVFYTLDSNLKYHRICIQNTDDLYIYYRGKPYCHKNNIYFADNKYISKWDINKNELTIIHKFNSLLWKYIKGLNNAVIPKSWTT